MQSSEKLLANHATKKSCRKIHAIAAFVVFSELPGPPQESSAYHESGTDATAHKSALKPHSFSASLLASMLEPHALQKLTSEHMSPVNLQLATLCRRLEKRFAQVAAAPKLH